MKTENFGDKGDELPFTGCVTSKNGLSRCRNRYELPFMGCVTALTCLCR